MRFGHYTVFDTPAENKHTQVYVEYDVPNKDNLDGATGSIFLTEGGQGPGGGEEGDGIKSITISPSITTTPTLDSLFPIDWEALPEGDIEDNVEVRYYNKELHTGIALIDNTEYMITIKPTSECHIEGDDFGGGDGETVTYTGVVHQGLLAVAFDCLDSTSSRIIAVAIAITE